MKDEPSDLVDFLLDHRLVLTILFVVALASFIGFVAFFGIGPLIEFLIGLFNLLAGYEEPFKTFIASSEDSFSVPAIDDEGAIFFIVYMALQVFFIWGIGKVYVAKTPGHKWKIGFAIFFIALGLTLISMGWIITALDFTDQLDHIEDIIEEEWELEMVTLIILGVGWVFWGVVGTVMYRSAGSSRGVIKLFEILLKGSWIQFIVVMPLYLAIQSKKNCPCFTGSFVTLVFGIPLLLLLIGPGLYLLYLKEKERAALDPALPRKILSRKTRWKM